MECFCGVLKIALRSRSQPWGNLNNHLKQLACLGQLGAHYDLEDELKTVDQFKVSNNLTRFEQGFAGCE